ncbi:MAG: hypothetical protein QM753_02385 [Thermomicrobiales bacterium]
MRSTIHASSNMRSGPNVLDRRDWASHERDARYEHELETILAQAVGWRLKLDRVPEGEIRWEFFAPVPEPDRMLICVIAVRQAAGDVFVVTFYTMNERAYRKTKKKGGIVWL